MTTPAQRGTTVVSDKAVRKVAERAAAEIAPARRTGGGPVKGTATVRGRRADVSVEVCLPYPTPLPETVRRLQSHVTSRTGELTGLDIGTARVGVTALLPAPAVADRAGAAAEAPAGPARTPLRWWAQRRVPMALLTLVATGACGALALDLVLVHLAHRRAASWRTGLMDGLSRHGPGDPAVAVGGGVLAVLGLLMILLALTPGRRGLLPMVSPHPRVGAAVDRSAVALTVRDSVGDVQGIDSVRVRVRRRRIKVRAQLAFGARDMARRAAEDAIRRALEDCRLGRAPKPRLKVRPCPAWEPGPDTSGPTRALGKTVQGASD